MQDPCLGHIERPVPGLPEPPHQIDLLEIEEKIRVEEADLGQMVEPHQNAGTRHPVDGAGPLGRQ